MKTLKLKKCKKPVKSKIIAGRELSRSEKLAFSRYAKKK